MQKIFITVSIIILTLTLHSCKKYLSEKPDQSLAIPTTLDDCQAILDNSSNMNLNRNNGLGEASADNYYLLLSDYNGFRNESNRSIYLWDKEIFYQNPPASNDWSNLYSVVYRCNIVLQTLQAINKTVSNTAAWDNAYGSALFFRGWAFFVLTINFAKAYDQQTANQDLGIPLKLSTDFNEVAARATLQQSYDRILDDLTAAVAALPVTPIHVMRPSKTAASALLARVYLAMRNYAQAEELTDAALALKSNLFDYNDPSLNPNAAAPFERFNPEIIFYASGFLDPLFRGKIAEDFFNSYAADDLRKLLFFRKNTNGTIAFKGNYSGSSVSFFCGIATDELYLMKAECLARRNLITEAMNIVNALLVTRWKQGTFIPFTAANQAEALTIILAERRKQLLMRDLRWMDIKRLNKEGAGITITRILDGQTYQLLPNDNRFALPLPANIIELTGMPQNPG